MPNRKLVSNRAVEIDSIISDFDELLGHSGLMSTAKILERLEEGGYDSTLAGLNEALAEIPVIRALEDYENLVDLVAEIVVNIHEEVYFSNITLPSIPDIGHDRSENIKLFIKYVSRVKFAIQPMIDDEVGSHEKNNFLSAIESKRKILSKGFFYEFTSGDLERAQLLINELREEITKSDLFEENHRARLLRRLESMQSEMHKKMSDVDRFWGLVGDAGIAIGKFGDDAKPFVDRIKELSQIVWKTQARAEELPSSIQNPLLESSE